MMYCLSSLNRKRNSRPSQQPRRLLPKQQVLPLWQQVHRTVARRNRRRQLLWHRQAKGTVRATLTLLHHCRLHLLHLQGKNLKLVHVKIFSGIGFSSARVQREVIFSV